MNPRETECVQALCAYLGGISGTSWVVEVPDLDSKYPNRPSPECVIGDGGERVAVEVKALKGPQDQSDFFGDLRYLGRVLAPTTPGHFVVAPPYDNSPRWEKTFVRQLKREIERVSQTLHSGGAKDYVEIPRRARLVMATEEGSLVSCEHGLSEPLRRASSLVRGTYLLIDEDGCVAIETDAGAERFSQAVAAACAKAKEGKLDVEVEWCDEWLIWRIDDDGRYVEVIAVWGAFSVPAAVDQTILKAIEDGRRKFAERWAPLHALLLDSQFAFTDVERVGEVLSTIRAKEYGDIDKVVLYWDGKVWPMYASTAPPAPSPPASA